MKVEYKQTSKITTYERIYLSAKDLFKDDMNRLNLWWLQRHDSLGGKAPYEMIKEGKGRKLLRIIEKCKS